jgi:hypothetical protein
MNSILSSSWHAYGKIFSMGHAYVQNIFDDEVLIEEKIDGSQFSFGVFNGELRARSKGMILDLNAPEKMFNKAIETIKTLQPLLLDGYTYRGEYLQKAKHNTLAYDRFPNNYIILFDISPSQETYLNYEDKCLEANRLGLEIVPCLYRGKVENVEQLKELLETMSILGSQKIEGFVVKNYKKFGLDGHILMAKHVSEDFKEIHSNDWKERHPTQNDIITKLVTALKTPARWNKAIQHLKERGELTNTPKDIGGLIVEVQNDVIMECSDYIKEELFKWAVNNQNLLRQITNSLPQYYKDKLLESQFKGKENESN